MFEFTVLDWNDVIPSLLISVWSNQEPVIMCMHEAHAILLNCAFHYIIYLVNGWEQRYTLPLMPFPIWVPAHACNSYHDLHIG